MDTRWAYKTAFLHGAETGHRSHHLGYDIAGPLENHHVTFAEILPADVILIVECGPFHRDTADFHRFQLRPRIEYTRSSHVDVNLHQTSLSGGRRELVGNGPTRIPAGRSQSRLQQTIIQLTTTPSIS